VINIHTKVNFDLELDHAVSLEFSDDDGVILSSYISLFHDDDYQEIETPLSRLIEECLELNKFDADYQTLYCISHELNRFAEKLRDTAQQMEDSVLVEDLFDKTTH